MAEIIPQDILEDLKKASELHTRTAADYQKCLEFNKLMSDILARLEDAGCDRMADRVMSILLDCNPREGAHCEHSTRIGDKVKKF